MELLHDSVYGNGMWKAVQIWELNPDGGQMGITQDVLTQNIFQPDFPGTTVVSTFKGTLR